MSTWTIVRARSPSAGMGSLSGARLAEADPGSDGGEGLDDEADVRVQVHPELFGAPIHVVAVDGAGERRVLELLFHRRHFEVGDGPARTHEGARGHEARQLIA